MCNDDHDNDNDFNDDIAFPGVVLGAPVICNDDHESNDLNDDDIGIPGVVLRTPAHVYNVTFEDKDCDN